MKLIKCEDNEGKEATRFFTIEELVELMNMEQSISTFSVIDLIKK